jgi:hypothetical protein
VAGTHAPRQGTACVARPCGAYTAVAHAAAAVCRCLFTILNTVDACGGRWRTAYVHDVLAVKPAQRAALRGSDCRLAHAADAVAWHDTEGPLLTARRTN